MPGRLMYAILLLWSRCQGRYSKTTNLRIVYDMHNSDKSNPENVKPCAQCGQLKPLTEFLRRTGRRAKQGSRRGTCRSCRSMTPVPGREMPAAAKAAKPPVRTMPPEPSAPTEETSPVSLPAAEPPPRTKRPRKRRRKPGAGARTAVPQADSLPPRRDKLDPTDASALKPTRQGLIRMRGKTDSGRRWYQEVELELAQILVREKAAVVVSRTTIRRLYSNKEFRKLILSRDNYTCRFCGQYGDTIDHVLPRSKGGHTTPVNCVCACHECNQRKASRDMDEFISSMA